MARITDRTILIVGASSGIGAEVARQLAPGKNRLVITARRAPELARLAEQVRAAGSDCLDIAADALDAREAADVVAAATRSSGPSTSRCSTPVTDRTWPWTRSLSPMSHASWR